MYLNELHEVEETDDNRKEPKEADETDENREEPRELNETEAPATAQEKIEIDEIDSELWDRVDKTISQCRVQPNKDVNSPLFDLAHTQRSIEEERNVRFSIDLIDRIVTRWREQNYDHLDPAYDYLGEYLDKLSLVRFPQGRALLQAVEIARGLVPPKKTKRLCSDCQLLASLCWVLQHQAGEKAFFLDGRSAAKAINRPHKTVASWLRVLASPHLGIIKRVSPGHPGIAARYVYIAEN